MSARLEAVESFIEARRKWPLWTGVPAVHRPQTEAEGYQVQRAVHDRLAAEGFRRVGYKIGSTSKEGQRIFGITEPIYAGIFAHTRHAALADALSTPLVAPSIECEIAFCFGHDVDPTLDDPSQFAAVVESCHLACEVIDNRYGDPLAVGVPTLLADDFFHAGFVLGPENASWRSVDLASLTAEIEVDGVVTRGCSANVLDALTAVQWLVRKLAQANLYLRAGDIVLTGSIAAPMPFKPPVRSCSLAITGFKPMTLCTVAG